MNSLPNDLLFYLFNFFHPIEQNELRLVCKRWKKIIKPKSFEYRARNEIKPFEINVDAKYNNNRKIKILSDEKFFYIGSKESIKKINKSTGKISKHKTISDLFYLFTYNKDNLIVITKHKIKFISKADLSTIEDNDIGELNKVSFIRTIIFHNKKFYSTTYYKEEYNAIYIHDTFGKELKKIKIDRYILTLTVGFNNIFTCSPSYLSILELDTGRISVSISLPSGIKKFVVNRRTATYCVQTYNFYLYIFNTRNEIIYKLEDNTLARNFLSGYSFNNYLLFYKDNIVMLFNLEKREFMEIKNINFKNYLSPFVFLEENAFYSIEQNKQKKLKILQY